MVDLPRKGEHDPNNVPFRGVQPAAFDIRDDSAGSSPLPLPGNAAQLDHLAEAIRVD